MEKIKRISKKNILSICLLLILLIMGIFFIYSKIIENRKNKINKEKIENEEKKLDNGIEFGKLLEKGEFKENIFKIENINKEEKEEKINLIITLKNISGKTLHLSNQLNITNKEMNINYGIKKDNKKYTLQNNEKIDVEIEDILRYTSIKDGEKGGISEKDLIILKPLYKNLQQSDLEGVAKINLGEKNEK